MSYSGGGGGGYGGRGRGPPPGGRGRGNGGPGGGGRGASFPSSGGRGRGTSAPPLEVLTAATWTNAAAPGVNALSGKVEKGMNLSAPPPTKDGLPRRPDFGKVGRRCVVRANHFVVQLKDQEFHHYDVRLFSLRFLPFLSTVLTVAVMSLFFRSIFCASFVSFV